MEKEKIIKSLIQQLVELKEEVEELREQRNYVITSPTQSGVTDTVTIDGTTLEVTNGIITNIS